MSQQFPARHGERGIRDAGIARFLLALDQAEFFQGKQGAGNARSGQAMALGQVDPAQPSARSLAEMVQEQEIIEAEAVEAAQCLVEPAHHDGLGTDQLQDKFEV